MGEDSGTVAVSLVAHNSTIIGLHVTRTRGDHQVEYQADYLIFIFCSIQQGTDTQLIQVPLLNEP